MKRDIRAVFTIVDTSEITSNVHGRRFAEMAWTNFGWLSMLCLWNILFLETEAREYCGRFHGKEYYCETGHCCGKVDCCSYYKYYEMWWFWLVWCVISVLGCCCAYHRRRSYARHTQIENFVYPSMLRSVASSPSCEELVTEPKYKLPSYSEVQAMENLGPPADGAGAPPAYNDPFVNEGPWNDAGSSYLNEALLDDRETATARSCPTASTEEPHTHQ